MEYLWFIGISMEYLWNIYGLVGGFPGTRLFHFSIQWGMSSSQSTFIFLEWDETTNQYNIFPKNLPYDKWGAVKGAT